MQYLASDGPVQFNFVQERIDSMVNYIYMQRWIQK
jgi:hypothetical protein